MTFNFKKLPDLQLFKNKVSNNTTSFRLQEPTSANKETKNLVFLHGFNGSSKSWFYQFTHFDKHKIIAKGYDAVYGVGLPNFDKIYQPMEKQGGPVLSQLEVNGRQSLCIADSNFVMLQFLLNYEWHACKDKRSTPVDTISSMLQVKRSIIPLMVDILPKLLHTNFTRTIFEQYKKSNWCDHTTWRSIKNNIRNTKFG